MSHQQVFLEFEDVCHDCGDLPLELHGVSAVEHIDNVVLVQLLHCLMDLLEGLHLVLHGFLQSRKQQLPFVLELLVL